MCVIFCILNGNLYLVYLSPAVQIHACIIRNIGFLKFMERLFMAAHCFEPERKIYHSDWHFHADPGTGRRPYAGSADGSNSAFGNSCFYSLYLCPEFYFGKYSNFRGKGMSFRKYIWEVCLWEDRAYYEGFYYKQGIGKFVPEP